MPRRVAQVNRRTQTPILLIGICGVVFSILAAVVPLAEIVKLVNIGTLFAFTVVNLGVIILRRTRPDMERGYRVPLVPWFPIIGIALCVYLATKLEADTWLRFFGWMPWASSSTPSTATGIRSFARARSSPPKPSSTGAPKRFPLARWRAVKQRGSVSQEEEQVCRGLCSWLR
jgi:amino acid transporter